MKPEPTTTARFEPHASADRFDAVRVRHVSQGEHVGRVAAGQGRHQGCGSRREDQLVVRQLVDLAAGVIQHRHRLVRPVDACDFLPRPHVDAKPASQELRRGDQQLLAIGDLAADIIGQAAVGEGHVFVLLQQDDLGVLVHAAGAGRGRSTAGDAAHNDDGQRIAAHTSPSLLSAL